MDRHARIEGALVFLALLGGCPSLAADELSVAFGMGRPPFVYQDHGKWTGFELDIAKEALKYKGHTIKKETHMPNKRLEVAASEMNFDAAVAVQYLDDGTYYSDNVVTYVNYAISRKKDKLVINSIEDLTKYHPVAWQNAYRNLGAEYAKYYGKEAKGPHLTQYNEFADQEAQQAFFWDGRANVVIVDKTIFLWYRKQLSGKYDTNVEVVFHNIFPKETNYQANFKSKKIRDDFNEGLRNLRETKKYQRLIDAYLY